MSEPDLMGSRAHAGKDTGKIVADVAATARSCSGKLVLSTLPKRERKEKRDPKRIK